MKTITFIGNNANGMPVTDGGRLKMRLFVKLLKDEGQNVEIIDIDNWKKRFLKIIKSIKVAVKRGDRIVIMAGPKGCRLIIPLVCRFNKKKLSKVIYCPVGIGTIDYLIKDLDLKKNNEFINCKNFYGIKDSKMKKHLENLDCICPENESLNKLYKTFYGLKNTTVINNFRVINDYKNKYSDSGDLKVIYSSRIKEYKGILELIDVVKDINENSKDKICLDIYGENQLTNENRIAFNNKLDNQIRYLGTIEPTLVTSKLIESDLFCLPTKYYAEGTSGSLIEAMIVGVTPLVSSYSQVNELIDDGKTGIIFEIDSKESLKAKLLWALHNRKELERIGKAARQSASAHTYAFNRNRFLEIMIGEVK